MIALVLALLGAGLYIVAGGHLRDVAAAVGILGVIVVVAVLLGRMERHRRETETRGYDRMGEE